MSTSITFTGGGGIYAGYGRVVLHTGSRVYNIAVPSGVVTDLGATPSLTHQFTESWTFWGVAEYYANALYLVYVRDGQTIARTRVPDGTTTTLGSFQSLGDMASFTFSTRLSRWLFHYEGTAQFGGSDETLGSAKALFTTDPGFPVILREPQDTRTYPGSNTTLIVQATGTAPLTYQWRFNGVDIDGATSDAYTLVNAQVADAGNYSVRVENASGSIVSATAALAVLTAPIIVTAPADTSAYPGEFAESDFRCVVLHDLKHLIK